MRWLKKIFNKLVDLYIEKAIIGDVVISISIVVILSQISDSYLCFKPEKIQSILDRINNHSMTLTGFILACLTIIISIKASIKRAKSTESSSNIEILFNSSHYRDIVSVFFKAMFIYGIIHILSHLAIIYSDTISFDFLSKSIIVLSIVTYSILLRCFLVLWLVIKHEIEK